jgi:alanine racemase
MLYQTHVQVHLDNIRFNLEGVRKTVGDHRKILIAVKANAYGHGAVPISKLAEAAGMDWLGVATVPEGIELRQADVKLPILKFNQTFPEEMHAAIEYNLALTVYDSENIAALQKVCRDMDKQTNVHLKVDTGMGRIGAGAEDAAEIANTIERDCPNLHLQGVFTHFPVSDLPDNPFTENQISLFKAVVSNIQDNIGRQIEIVHAANSGAVLDYPDAWFDMVRPGIMVYGYYPDKQTAHSIPLKPGLSFHTRVSSIKQVKAGTSISYGRTWQAPVDTHIGTIPVGYADGFNRLFSNQGRVLINRKSYPVVGRVCMDQTMLDLGAETDVKVGDEVVLIGHSGEAEITCDEWAEKLDTITYEVTCQINSRVKHYYTGE